MIAMIPDIDDTIFDNGGKRRSADANGATSMSFITVRLRERSRLSPPCVTRLL